MTDQAPKVTLKPCPFCGSEVTDYPNPHGEPLIVHPMGNGQCVTAGKFYNRAAWNTRASTGDDTGLRELLREAREILLFRGYKGLPDRIDAALAATPSPDASNADDVVEALRAHHEWHLGQEEADDGTGGAEAYADSALCDRTVRALSRRSLVADGVDKGD